MTKKKYVHVVSVVSGRELLAPFVYASRAKARRMALLFINEEFNREGELFTSLKRAFEYMEECIREGDGWEVRLDTVEVTP
jgi:hypothetical protein